jgi:tRNA 2-thiocytidine biosynthesis protein TtcA
LRRAALVPFEVTAVTLHPGFPGFDPEPISSYCAEMGFPHFMEPTPIHDILEEKKTALTDYCAYCARFRRGILYTLAKREGFNRIALGHHADDLIETLLMAQFFTGEIKSMPPLLHADDGVNVVIRPLCYLFEQEIVRYSDLMRYPIVRCGCPVGDAPHKMRLRVKRLLGDLEAEHPGIKANLLSSLGRVRLRYLMPGRFGSGEPESEAG